MKGQTMTRQQWLRGINKHLKAVGECVEWQGPFMGKTPVVYTPAGYAWEGSKCGRQSLRSVLFGLDRGHRLSSHSVIRMKCMNDSCAHLDHFYVIPRSHQAKEQAKRGELSTPRRRAAATAIGRSRAKLTQEQVDEIKASRDSSRVEGAKHGVSDATVRAIRSGRLWANTVFGASVFNWNGTL